MNTSKVTALLTIPLNEEADSLFLYILWYQLTCKSVDVLQIHRHMNGPLLFFIQVASMQRSQVSWHTEIWCCNHFLKCNTVNVSIYNTDICIYTDLAVKNSSTYSYASHVTKDTIDYLSYPRLADVEKKDFWHGSILPAGCMQPVADQSIAEHLQPPKVSILQHWGLPLR